MYRLPVIGLVFCAALILAGCVHECSAPTAQEAAEPSVTPPCCADTCPGDTAAPAECQACPASAAAECTECPTAKAKTAPTTAEKVEAAPAPAPATRATPSQAND